MAPTLIAIAIVAGKIFVAAVMPLYAGYVGASVFHFVAYMLVLGACWAFQADPDKMRGEPLRTKVLASLLMTGILAPLATILYVAGRFLHWLENSN